MDKEHASGQYIRNIVKKYDNVTFFDIRNQLCQGNECSPYFDGEPVYFNAGHLSMIGSEIIGRRMIKQHDPILKVFKRISK